MKGKPVTLTAIILWGAFLLPGACSLAPREPIEAGSSPPAQASAIDWAEAEEVEVLLDEFDFNPRRLVLESERAYRLRLRNTGSFGHNFDAPAFFRTAVLRDTEVAERIRASGGVVELQAGGMLEVALVPLEEGMFPLECSHFLHAGFGMTGSIEVR